MAMLTQIHVLTWFNVNIVNFGKRVLKGRVVPGLEGQVHPPERSSEVFERLQEVDRSLDACNLLCQSARSDRAANAFATLAVLVSAVCSVASLVGLFNRLCNALPSARRNALPIPNGRHKKSATATTTSSALATRPCGRTGTA